MSDATIHSFTNLNRLSQTEAVSPSKYAGPQSTAPTAVSQLGPQTTAIKPDQAILSVASGLVTKALSVPDVRADKVASLQKAIAAGTYHVSSSDVAGKLLQSLLGE